VTNKGNLLEIADHSTFCMTLDPETNSMYVCRKDTHVLLHREQAELVVLFDLDQPIDHLVEFASRTVRDHKAKYEGKHNQVRMAERDRKVRELVDAKARDFLPSWNWPSITYRK